MAANSSPIVLLTLLGIATLGLTAATPARAQEAATPLEPRRNPVVAVEILESLDRPEIGKGWLGVHLDRLRFHKKYGLTYTQRVERGEQKLNLTVRGPVLGKALSSQRRIGISFEIEF